MAHVLLIVDDRDDQLRALRRVFLDMFDEVRVAHDCGEAETCLEQSPPITHLICDMWLGDGHVRGDTLIADWRKRYPSIEVAALVTGDTLDDASRDGIDVLVEKPVDPEYIKTIFGLESTK